MKKRTKVILGIVIVVLFAYSVIATFAVRETIGGNYIAEKATENRAEYYQMMSFAYSLASAIESGKYDEEDIDYMFSNRAKQMKYDEKTFRKCVELILKSE